jgi:hypothetical protein
MNDKLRDLVTQASNRVDAANSERQAASRRKQDDELENDAQIFRGKVETVLGKEVLDAIGPVTFHKSFMSNSMTFEQDSRNFRLHQVTGLLMQLEEDYRMFGNQFNLNNHDAKDTFLHTLGSALEAKNAR